MSKLIFLIFTIPAILSCRHIGSDTTRYSHEFEIEPTFYEEFDFEDNGKSIGWHKDWVRLSGSQNSSLMTIDRASLKDGFLHIRTTDYTQVRNDNSYVALGGSVNTRRYYSYGKWEARLKPSSEAGVVNAFFTQDWDNTNQEIDIEFTPYTFDSEKGTGEIHLVVHDAPDHNNHYKKDVKVDFNPSEDFHVYSIEIYTDKVVWKVDGNFLAEYIYDDIVAIDSEYQVYFNGWSSTKAWVKGPPAQTAHYYIDWVKFYPLKELD